MNARIDVQQTHALPPQLSHDLARAVALLQQDKSAEAIQIGQELAEANPGQARVHAFMAEAFNVTGDHLTALEWINKAIECSNDPQYKIKKAWLLVRAHRGAETWELMDALSAQAGEDSRLLWQLGKFYSHHNRLPEAVIHYERALDAGGGNNHAWRYDLAIARFFSGDAAGAEPDLDRILDASAHSGATIYLRSTLRKQTLERNHITEIKGWLNAGFRREEDQAGALYALAKELEDLGRHEDSFDALAAGARKKRETFQYDVHAVTAGLREMREEIDAQSIAAPVNGDGGEGAIFILGMPRTGTTLTERILLQSGTVKNAGELMEFGAMLSRGMHKHRESNPALSQTQAALQVDFAALGRAYMAAAKLKAGDSVQFIDKMPANYLYCGMIHKALPKARIIHLVRDPLDSCYAIYKTLFFQAYEFSYDLEELAEYYIAYYRLMRHWHAVMPGTILDVRYEDLVNDTETQARRIYDWCGLEWTPKALDVPDAGVYATASAAQVRQPIHTRSVNSSRRHAERLQPLVRKLVDAGILDQASMDDA